MISNWRDYYELDKPNMVYANLLVAAAGFAYASVELNWLLLVVMLIGLGCIIGSACAFNNYFDRHIDAKMERTKHRVLVRGALTPHEAATFASLLLFVGVALLWLTTAVALATALVGFAVYVGLYTPLKHKTPWALYVGAVAGATPPVVGYAAVHPVLNDAAALLFVFLFVWQVPHFLSIAVYRGDEYAAAKVPLFMRGPYTAKQKRTARAVFYSSLVVLLAWCVILMVHR
jgi:protoheme IX farnesyltransferase